VVPASQDGPGSGPAAGQVALRTCNYPQDFPDILTLWGRAGPGVRLGRSDAPEQIEKKLKRDPDLFLVAELDGRIVGSVLGGFDGRRGLVYHLAVDPHYRQHDIGSRLMEELENRLRAKGCLRAYLLVTKNNPQAMQFYERHGWARMEYLDAFGKDLS